MEQWEKCMADPSSMKTIELTRELEDIRLQLGHSNAALRRLIGDFNRAMEQGSAAVYRRNFDARVYEYMGPSIEAITGYSVDEITPEIWDGLVVNAEFKGPLRGLPVAEANLRVRSGQVDRWQADVEIRNRAGETRWVMDLSTVSIATLRAMPTDAWAFSRTSQTANWRNGSWSAPASSLRAQNTELESDLALAGELQAALMPEAMPGFPANALPGECALRFHRRYQPTGAVGGDFFDVMSLSGSKAGVFICDVMGHGVRSALVTGMIRALMEQLQAEAEYPGLFLARINQALNAILTRAHQPMYATAFYMVVDVISGEAQYASAGHPAPLHIRHGGEVNWMCSRGERSGAGRGLAAGCRIPHRTHPRRAGRCGAALYRWHPGCGKSGGG